MDVSYFITDSSKLHQLNNIFFKNYLSELNQIKVNNKHFKDKNLRCKSCFHEGLVIFKCYSIN